MTDEEIQTLYDWANDTHSEHWCDDVLRLVAEVRRLRSMIEAAKENTDGGCAFCRQDPFTEGHAEDCGK